MLNALGLALLAAIEPLGVVAFIAVLGSGGGRRNTRWFIVGWTLCACVVALVTVLFSGGSGGDGRVATAIGSAGLLQITLGVAALVYLVVRRRRGRAVVPRDDVEDEAEGKENLGPLGAATIAAALQGWPVVAGAVAAVLKATSGTGGRLLGVAAVIVVSASTFVAAHVLAGREPERTAAWLEALRGWIERHRDRVIEVLLLGGGGYLIAHGVIVQLTT